MVEPHPQKKVRLILSGGTRCGWIRMQRLYFKKPSPEKDNLSTVEVWPP